MYSSLSPLLLDSYRVSCLAFQNLKRLKTRILDKVNEILNTWLSQDIYICLQLLEIHVLPVEKFNWCIFWLTSATCQLDEFHRIISPHKLIITKNVQVIVAAGITEQRKREIALYCIHSSHPWSDFWKNIVCKRWKITMNVSFKLNLPSS